MILVIRRFLKGMAIGIANIIPGVSGGTLALMLNIYEPLIEGIHNISLNTFVSFFKLFTFKRENVEDFKQEMKKINFSLLFFIVAGAGAAILAFSGLMTFLMQNYQSPTYGFFFGLILISIAIPFNMIKKINLKVIIVMIVAIVLIIGLTVLDTDAKKIEKEEQSIALDAGETIEGDYLIGDYVMLGLSGAVAMSTMIVPGVSGSFMLLLMGKYFMVLEAVSSFNIVVIVVFGIGAVLGLLLFSKVLNYLLKKQHDTTMGFLTGLVIGSLWAVWPFKALHTLSNGEIITLSNIVPTQLNAAVLVTIGTIIAGVSIVFLMIKMDRKPNK